MANEITLTQTIAIANGAFVFAKTGDVAHLVDQSAAGGGGPGVVSIPTTAGGTSVANSNVATPGYVYMKNLDATNYVTYGPTSGGAMIAFGRLKPGESTIYRQDSSVTMRLMANTAACKVAIYIFEA